MAKLAIKGHETRGKEVIEILEMLGAKNCDLKGCGYNLAYYIRTDGYIGTSYTDLSKDYKVFTLEEFLEKFPYKVGDKVKVWVNGYRGVFDIQDIAWYSLAKEVNYKIRGCWLSARDLQPYKEETMEETDTMNHTSEINLNHPVFKGCNEIELIIPNGWEFERRGNKMFGVRKQYPKTYEECCELLSLGEDGRLYTKGYKANLIQNFQKLLICRDAYWKIASDWKPNWEDEIEIYYTISYDGVNIKCYNNTDVYSKLAFPTKEMRDTFYENFKDLIEECKEFL